MEDPQDKPAPLRVLALDDSLTIRRLIGLVVKAPEYDLSLAEDGCTGLEMLRRDTPDVLLLDYMLPDMKGSDLCEALASHLAARNVTVIVMSGKGDDVAQHFESFEVVKGYLHKPFKPDDLRPLLASVSRGEAPVTPSPKPIAPAPSAPKSVSVGRTTSAPGPTTQPSGQGVEPTETVQAAQRSTPEPFTREELGRAAQLAFRVLKPALERIPAWNTERAGRPAASFFASKLLTPAAIVELLEGLTPLYEARQAPEVSVDPDQPEGPEAHAA